MIHKEEFRCTQESAILLMEKNSHNQLWYPLQIPLSLGIPIIVNADVPEGKIQFWRDGKMVKEVEL